MRVTVDHDLCIGSGNCVRLAEEVFTQSDDEGLVVLLVERPAAEHRSAVRDAAGACPTGAITVVDDDAE